MILREHVGGSNGNTEDMDTEMVIAAILKALMSLEEDNRSMTMGMTNGNSGSGGGEAREKLRGKIGGILGDRVFQLGRYALAYAVLQDT